MRIQLTQSEIEVALREYVSNQGFNLTNKQMTITFTNTRNPTSTLADIDIVDADAPVIERLQAVPSPVAEVDTNNPGLSDDDGVTADEPEVEAIEKKSLFG